MIIGDTQRITLARRLGIDQKYQHKIICDRSPRILIIKSASIGLSYAVSFKKLLDAFEVKKQYMFVSIRHQNVLNLINYIHYFYGEIEKLIDGIPLKKTDAKNEIMFSNGSQIISLPADPDAMRTWHGDVVLDEIDFAFDQTKLITTAKGRAKPPPTQIIALTTCNESGSYVNQIYNKEINKNKNDRVWKIYTIPYIDCTIKGFKEEIDIERIEAVEDGRLDEWEREYTCKWVDKSTRLFTWALIGECTGEDEHIKGYKAKFLGIDFGQKVDETIIRAVGDDGRGNIKVLFKISYGKVGYTEQLEGIKQLIKSNKDIVRVFIDKTGIGIRLHEELQESEIGYLIEPIYFSAEAKERMAMFLYGLMNSHKIEFPKDEKLHQQIHNIERTRTQTGVARYKHQTNKHDDEFWALCLALQGYMRDETNPDDIKLDVSGERKVDIDDLKITRMRHEIRRTKL